MVASATREVSPNDMVASATREGSPNENFLPLVFFKVLLPEEPELSSVGERIMPSACAQEGNPPLKEAEEKRYQSLDISPNARKPRKYKYFEKKSKVNSAIQKTEQWLDENPLRAETFDNSGHIFINGEPMRLLSQASQAKNLRRYRLLPSRKGCSGELFFHNGYLVRPLSQTPNAQALRAKRNALDKDKNKAISKATWAPLHPRSAQKKVLEQLAAIEAKAEKKAREEEPGTSGLPPEFPESMPS